jgi:hypothetical protein
VQLTVAGNMCTCSPLPHHHGRAGPYPAVQRVTHRQRTSAGGRANRSKRWEARKTGPDCARGRMGRPPFSRREHYYDSVTCNRSPEVSSIAFHAQPPDLPPVPLMDMSFAVSGPLARYRRPQIQFLSIGSCLLRASFGSHLTMTPLRFTNSSPPSG